MRELAGLPEEGRGAEALLDASAALWDSAVLLELRTSARSSANQWSEAKARLALTVDLQLRAALDPLDREASRLERGASFFMKGGQNGVEGESISLAGALASIGVERNADRRRAIERERTRTAADVMGANRRAALLAEAEVLRDAGGGTIRGAIAALTSAADDGRDQCAALLGVTESQYREALQRLRRDRLQGPAGGLTRSDVLPLFFRQPADRQFDGAILDAAARRQAGQVGLEPLVEQVRFDLVSRAGKRPRAATVPVDVPGEIVIVAWPMDGLSGRRAMWHEIGHALHLAAQPESLEPMLRRRPDRAVAEGWAILFGSIPGAIPWLRAEGVSRTDATAQSRDLAAADLFLARRYAARWRVELAMLEDPGARGHGDDYAESLWSATGIEYSRDEALFDRDPGLAGIEYLRGWALAAGWAAELREQFNEDWYFNPAAGGWLMEAFRQPTTVVDWVRLATALQEGL
ncbi:MAG: hypothetical protein ABJC74_06395 [Gemmatimonadota bacterium]